MKNINVPVGISNFEKIRQDGYYYVDKTGLIKDMLKNKKQNTRSNINYPTTKIWKNSGNEYVGKLF